MLRILVRGDFGGFSIFGTYESIQMTSTNLRDIDGDTILYYNTVEDMWVDKNDDNYYFEWIAEEDK